MATPLQDILKITVPKVPTAYQEEVMNDESYAYAGCIDMMVNLGLDGDFITETTITSSGEEEKHMSCTLDLTLRQKWLAALFTYKCYLERLKDSLTRDAINFKTLTFELKSLDKRPENINESLYTLNRYLSDNIAIALECDSVVGIAVQFGGDNYAE